MKWDLYVCWFVVKRLTLQITYQQNGLASSGFESLLWTFQCLLWQMMLSWAICGVLDLKWSVYHLVTSCDTQECWLVVNRMSKETPGQALPLLASQFNKLLWSNLVLKWHGISAIMNCFHLCIYLSISTHLLLLFELLTKSLLCRH